MPRIIVDNFDPGFDAPGQLYRGAYQTDVSSWKASVRKALAQAVLETRVPGISTRDQITINFGERWEPHADSLCQNPMMAVIEITDFYDTPERTDEIRRGFAQVLGKALLPFLPRGWLVEVIPHRYQAAVEGAVRIGSDGEQVPDS